MDGYLKSSQVAVLMGLYKQIFYDAVGEIPDFPKPVIRSQTHWYKKLDIDAWLQVHDVKQVFGAAAHQKRIAIKAQKQAAPGFDQVSAKAFITGAFLPKPQKQAVRLKQLTAKYTQPKTVTVRTPDDWGGGPLAERFKTGG